MNIIQQLKAPCQCWRTATASGGRNVLKRGEGQYTNHSDGFGL